jgi:hypothetical protein
MILLEMKLPAEIRENRNFSACTVKKLSKILIWTMVAWTKRCPNDVLDMYI